MSLTATTSSSSNIAMADEVNYSWTKRLYGLGITMIFLVIAGASATVSHQLFTNFFPTTNEGWMPFGAKSETTPAVYFLKSDSTITTMRGFGMGEYNYIERLELLAEKFTASGAQVQIIGEADISTLPQNAALFAIDTIGLSDMAVAEIQQFTANGGFLFFNYHFAYHGGSAYRDNQVISDITDLSHPTDLTHVTSDGPVYLTSKILSPLSQRIFPKGYKLDLELYDAIPVFKSESIAPAALITNWTVSAGLKVATKLGQRQLQPHEAGGLWHGRFGKGNWVYTNLPSYSFLSSADAEDQLTQFIGGIVDFATSPLVVVSYPYKDADKVTFVSQDTEYRYESFGRFIAAANRYQMPVTTFLVADLSERNPHLVTEAEISPYIEIASHSYTHKKIVGTSSDNISKETRGAKSLINSLTADKEVTGFRPPREELNTEMLEELEESGHEYVFEKRKDYLYPTIENPSHILYTIPRNATDDYQYLVLLDWGPDQILERMKAEAELQTMLNGVYSLSVHTHLMSYKGNIKVIEDLFAHLNTQSHLTPLTGMDIITRVKELKAISYKVSKSSTNFIVEVQNTSENQIKDLNFRVFWPNGVQLGEITSEIMRFDPRVKHNPIEGYSDIALTQVSPQSKLSIIIAYNN